MIRPFTFLCALLAAGSGLYLYQAKQQARVIDRQIEDIRARTAATHQRAEVLRAEYTLLNDPTRLAGLAATYLPDLKPTQPAQWSSMAQLDKRLPPVGATTAAPGPLEPASPGATTPDAPIPMAAAQPAPEASPAPRREAPSVAVAELPRPAAGVAELPRPAPVIAELPRPAQAIARTTRPAVVARVPAPRPAVAFAREPAAPVRRIAPHIYAERLPPPTRAEPRASRPSVPRTQAVAALRPAPRPVPVEPPATPMVASALGMARTMLAPVTPANAATIAPERDRDSVAR